MFFAHEKLDAFVDNAYGLSPSVTGAEDVETPLWARNVFKKLWWAGLDRDFVAVQWRGNEGQIPLELPKVGHMAMCRTHLQRHRP